MAELHKIKDGTPAVLRLLPKGEPAPGKTYRLCRYLCLTEAVEAAGSPRIFHTLTGEMWETAPETAALLASLPRPYAPWMDEFIRARVLVPQEYDEAADIKMLRWLGENCSDRADHMSFTVLPTTACNAACFYCYEKHFEKLPMTPETARQTVEYMVRKAAGRPIRITWFGGEPLMGLPVIEQISADLTARGIRFTAGMISNGSLFTEALAKKAAADWHLQRVQITLDGTRDNYARIKNYDPAVPLRDASPYDVVTGNIGFLLDAGIGVNVRLNVSPANGDDLAVLTEELLRRFRGRPKFRVYCCGLFGDESEPYSLTDAEADTIRAHCRRIDDIILRCRDADDPASAARRYDFRWVNCMADDNAAEVIAPDGTLHKCEHFSADYAYGDIWHGVTDPDTEHRFRSLLYPAQCEHCPALPICTLLEKCPVISSTPDPYTCEKKLGALRDLARYYRST